MPRLPYVSCELMRHNEFLVRVLVFGICDDSICDMRYLLLILLLWFFPPSSFLHAPFITFLVSRFSQRRRLGLGFLVFWSWFRFLEVSSGNAFGSTLFHLSFLSPFIESMGYLVGR